MKILIATGIYPPDIGGPAQYARNLYETWKSQGHEVKVAAYRWERALPPVIKHLLYGIKIMRKGWNADLILVLDTFLAAVPTMIACTLMHKKYVIRTGGDLLWEWYVERTGEMILLKDFYEKRCHPFSLKEKIIKTWSTRAFRNAAAIIFSTPWQRTIFEKAYQLDPKKNYIVENYCGQRLELFTPDSRSFVAGTRSLKWKNLEVLNSAFKRAQGIISERSLPEITLDKGKAVYDSFLEKIHQAYAVILVSLGDISPNMIFDAIRAGTPFILTRETGIAERVKDCAIFVDPQNEKEIADKIVWLSDPKNRAAQQQKLAAFDFTHSWVEVADEIVRVAKMVTKSANRIRRQKQNGKR